ncbi:MAG TPA: hypothetical protein VH024_17575 [Candidatus Angelobacter sp.]|jgi:hypothetical protein|nr:hypothetical protein [Candidatus Angelobacter sp.]
MINVVNGRIISGPYSVNGDYVFTASSQVENASISAGYTMVTGYHGPGIQSPFADVTVHGTIGANDTFTVGMASLTAVQYPSKLELASNPTSATDTINVNYGMLQLDTPISFLDPPPEKINVNWAQESGSAAPAPKVTGALFSFLTPWAPFAPTWTAHDMNFSYYHHNWSIHINEPMIAVKPEMIVSAAAGGNFLVTIAFPGAPVPAGGTVMHPTFA